MKTLSLTEMESVQGGSCGLAVAGTVLAFVGMFALGPVTGGASWIALATTAGSFIVGSAGIGYSC